MERQFNAPWNIHSLGNKYSQDGLYLFQDVDAFSNVKSDMNQIIMLQSDHFHVATRDDSLATVQLED